MTILSHRGYWKTIEEKNSMAAFERSFRLGFGTETDIRDLAGTLVVSHDTPTGGEPTCEDLFALFTSFAGWQEMPLALNVKSDGIQKLLRPLLERFAIGNYFLFDMSIPEQVVYARDGFRLFSRQSEYEPAPAMLDKADGVWLDGFHGTWFDETVVAAHREVGKKVCVVSPDLHKRPHLEFWKTMSGWSLLGDPDLMLCTDLPEDAKEFFHGK